MSLLVDLIRCVLIYIHLLLFGVSIALVFWGDLRILAGKMTNSDYHYIGTVILRLFLGLWLTGLLVIYIDTGFNYLALSERPKLLTKLACIFMLSVNAVILHKICLGILTSRSKISLAQALTLSICGVVSTSHWLIAAFVGSAKILDEFSIATLLSVYLIVFGFVLLTGIAISPHMKKRLNRQRAF